VNGGPWDDMDGKANKSTSNEIFDSFVDFVSLLQRHATLAGS
jgi:hypothetical protein